MIEVESISRHVVEDIGSIGSKPLQILTHNPLTVASKFQLPHPGTDTPELHRRVEHRKYSEPGIQPGLPRQMPENRKPLKGSEEKHCHRKCEIRNIPSQMIFDRILDRLPRQPKGLSFEWGARDSNSA